MSKSSLISPLDLEQLHKLDDGILAAAFRANLKLIIDDLRDRPNDDRTRKLTIEFALKPEALGGDLDRVSFEYKVKHNIAGHEGRKLTLTPKILGREMNLMFANSGVDATQPELPGMQEE